MDDLQRIALLANPERGAFSITHDDTHPEYYKIAVGEFGYYVHTLDETAVHNALIAITTKIAIKENWYA